MGKGSLFTINSTNQLLLLCSRLRIDEIERDNFEKILAEKSFSWEQILSDAFKNSVLPFVYFHLKNFNLLSKIPDDAREKLEKFYHFNTARNAWILLSLEKVAEALSYRNIPFILIQGTSLLADVYSNPSLRYLSDIDILIKEENLNGIEDIISPLEWKMSDYPRDKEWCLKNLNHLPLFYRAGQPVPLEIHFKLSYPEGVREANSSWIWEKAPKAKIRSAQAPIPSPENIILHLSMHIFKKSHINDLTILLRHCCDISAILERYGVSGINVDDLILTSYKAGLTDVLYHSLKVSNSVIRSDFLDRIINNISGRISNDIKNFSEFVSACLAQPDQNIKVHLAGWELFFDQKGIIKKIIFFFKHLFPSIDFMEKEYGVSKLKKRLYFYYFLRPFFLLKKFTWTRFIMAYRISKLKESK